MSPMYNACLNSGTPGPPPNLGAQMPSINGPSNMPPNNLNNLNNLNEPPGFYNSSPHFNNQAPPPPPHSSVNFNNQIPRNIQSRQPNYQNFNIPPIYEFKIYELTRRLSERPDVSLIKRSFFKLCKIN